MAQGNAKDLSKVLQKKQVYQEISTFFRQHEIQIRGQKTKNQQQIQKHPLQGMFTSKDSSLLRLAPQPSIDHQQQNRFINQHLCSSFEGLMKKENEETDCSTRNTVWSSTAEENSNQSEEKRILMELQSNYGQNQKQLQDLNNENLVEMDKNTTSLQKIDYKDNIIEEKIQKTMKIALEKRSQQQKCKKYRNLLPYYYSSAIPQQIKEMLKKAEQIDRYLGDKKNGQFIDNIQNIFKTLFYDEQTSSIWSTIRKIIFLAEEYYQIRVDPLKNICLGFGCKKDFKLYVRKERLRKVVFDYYTVNKSQNIYREIPQAYIEPSKIAKFYPENLSICKKSLGKSNSLKSQYLQSIKSKISEKQGEFNQVETDLQKCQSLSASPSTQSPLPSPEQLQSFCDQISQIYAQKRVFHMYKVSLIQNLRKRSHLKIQSIFSLLSYIIKEGIFLQILVKSGCQILKIRGEEKEMIIKVLNMKIAHKTY